MIQIYELRMQEGITQKKLAEDLHISAGNLCDWEKGRSEPDIAKMILLADYFDVSLDVLVGRERVFQPNPDFSVDKNKCKLLEIYKQLSPEKQKTLVEFLESFTE